ncbi:MAG: CPBP family intramembrane metalloprotease [Clostridiales bacterium]|nr:CPBP family intramembrane metalloprotease [Clostridiales bacterium]MDD2572015.1 CPBP family intramembrane metalloprotease [Eubacteriales bacterium]MDD3418628.1 CPBP family intramembrane metalloprotease [Eubacteriales bacterium]MDD3539855.1 CPBP family intramembrane metalloprotease [Eubacteriales bacterium]
MKIEHEKDFRKTGRRMSVRTFLTPILFMVLHHLVLNLASVILMFAHLASHPELGQSLLQNSIDSETLTKILVEGNIMTWASLSAMIVLIPLYLAYLYYWKKKDQSLLLTERAHVKQWGSALAIILGATGLTQLWMALLSSFDPMSFLGHKFQDYLDKVALFDGRTATIALELVVTVFLVPIGEELLFRGIIQGELRRAFRPFVSVIGTTLLFALFHLDLIQGSYVLIAGFALSAAYHFTRQIFVPIAMHILFNFVGSGWLSRLIGADETTEVGIIIGLYAFILVGAFGYYYLWREQKKKDTVQV